MKKGLFIGIIAVVAVVGGIFTIKSCELIDTGKVGIVYSYKGGVEDKVLQPGLNFISPIKKVKQFSTSNEILVLSKDKREGSKDDDSFTVATSDDASIALSFQMSYRYDPDKVINTYKNFRGMNGDDIVETRVKTVLKSKISEVTTNYSMMDIYSGNRSAINKEITDALNTEFHEKYGIEVLDASIIDVHPDKKLKESIDNRVKALQEKQQAEAEQQKIQVQKETEKMQAEADAQIEITKAQAEAESNRIISESITDNLIRMKEAEAREKHGWVTVNGANTVVTDDK